MQATLCPVVVWWCRQPRPALGHVIETNLKMVSLCHVIQVPASEAASRCVTATQQIFEQLV
jgi:hypothetical protein